ncbi:beta-glucoside-specific PTS transporter subunit IIABC [Demequina mangrovi]|uniref:PTS system beta-glucoside-specific IIA component, Glc family /PTS system beta-glucoside-specific IIB component, Glc family /PTS system beta-glucoside-specific IIC component, Glc family n=1 Tax=Demequina mangrovi TaxID=1043493 RepID=A0A1H6U6E4_9MICO|nr:beta-glucoside-specific PTS transporter subunit IIABC [Demequina mangrovi]SEI87903.1 PTS system beta-glucoside-specific IIA component, Glc family /PTS system beta-glucoside-specific IIB component, Glc family /PTS system beta-glucoside-specific IIC component, Glc family [Demequina mangrovi]
MATATKHEVIADAVLAAIGGAGNVKSVTHCATRLRFQLVDRDKADKAKVEATRGVITVMESGGQFQVVIGNTVGEVYQAVIRHEGISVGDAPATGGFMARLIDLVTSIFTPFLWVLAGTGLIKAALAVATTISPAFGDTSTYAIFYAASDATFQFLPLFLAVTAAKKFKANQWSAIAIVGALLYSETIAVIANAEGVDVTLKAFADGGGELTFFGIPVLMPAYLSAVIPAIFAVYVQSKLERLLDRVMPEAIKNFVNPMLVIGAVVPFTFLVVGPLSAWLGDGLAWVVDNLWALSPAVGGALLGAGWQVFVIFGLHWALLPLFMVGLTTVGYSLLTGPLFAAVAAQGAAAFAVFLKTKNKDLKGVAGPASLSGIVAGITEPAIYGVTLRLKKPFIYGVIGGAVGGAIAAIGGSAAEGFVLPSALTVVSTINIGNFTLQLIGTGLAMLIAFSLTMILGFKDLPASEDEPSAAIDADGVVVAAPVAGTVIPLAEVNDKVFSSGALGSGAGVLPTDGTIASPIDGEVVSVMPHAFGIRAANGVEVLVHVGIDTVRLGGTHFAPKVTQGESVSRGQTLVEVDLAALVAVGYDTTTIVVVTKAPEGHSVTVSAEGAVAGAGDLLTVVR